MEMVLLMVDDGGHAVRVVEGSEKLRMKNLRLTEDEKVGSSFEDHDPAARRRHRENPAVGDPAGGHVR